MTVLPTFLIIGAPKAGTTSLHTYLAEHPQIAMSSVKEPMCFAGPDWEDRLAHYDNLFTGPAPIRGESSTAYSSYPWAPEVPARVATTVPSARLVYLVRDPIPRTLSHYAQNVWDGKPVKPFDELMEQLDDPWNMPVWCSRYATQLDRWRRHFPEDRILVLDEAELRHDRVSAVQRVLGFLGADATFVSPDWSAEHNAAISHRVPRRGLARLAPHRGGEGVVGRLVTREVARPVLRPAQRDRLAALLQPEAERLEASTGVQTAGWTL